VTGTRRRALGAALVLFALAGTACGGDRVEGTSGKQIKQLPADTVPAELLGLPLAQEDMSGTVAGVEDAVVVSVGLYSMRRDDLLQATLQVSRFRDNAPVEQSKFRSSLVNQIGGTRVQRFRMGDDVVYRTTGRKQTISMWFRDRHLFVLSARETYESPRALLREALEIDPT
jgi:hypothetical protein